ncbi:MAG: DUF192 domain-containing protein [Deltaproteobacteria bacterium]|nr:DUF192 domain-containing protein [Deltaproteobacteria bacterium]
MTAPPPEVQVTRCAGVVPRLVGLIGRPAPEPGAALWLTPCRQVHTAFMRYPIDVVFLDVRGAVVTVQTLRPWRLSAYVWRAASVLELAAGTAAGLGLAAGVVPRLIAKDVHASRIGALR